MAENSEMTLPDRIAESFSGKSIFITGGTGFIGKVLVEKILRRCPDVGNIYMLIRPKKGKSAKQRLVEMFNNDLFRLARNIYTLDELVSKVTLIEGDVSSQDLGLSKEKTDLCSKAEIVIHSAACVRFDADLKESILLNTRGTKYVLELAKEFKKLELFVYISTAFCHPEVAVLEEIGYKPRYNPHEMTRVVEVTDENTLCALTPAILSDLPNSYTLSKALAEELVEEASNELPTLTLRPSVVIPTLREPIPGWTDNLNGPMGLFLAGGKGVLRTFHAIDMSHVDVIPADVAVDITMVAVWNYLKNGDRSRYINLTTSSEVIVPWSCVVDVGRDIGLKELPLNNVLCLVRVHNRISKGVQLLDYYVNEHKFVFQSDIIRKLRKLLNSRERTLYTLKLEMDAYDYFKNCMKCLRLYILNESDETIPAARRHITRLKYLSFGVAVIFWYLVAKYTSIPLALGIFIILNASSLSNSKVIYK